MQISNDQLLTELQNLLGSGTSDAIADLQKRVANLRQDQTEYIRDATAAGDRLNDIALQHLEHLKRTATYRQEEILRLEEAIPRLQQLAAQEGDRRLQIERQKILQEEQAKLDKLKLDDMERALRLGKDINEEEYKKLKAKERLNKVTKQGNVSLGNSFKLQQKSHVSLTKMAGAAQSIADAFRGGWATAMAKFAALGLSIIKQLVESAIDLAINLYDVENAFMRATGATQDFAKGVTETYAATRQYGVTVEQASKANEALYRNFTDFTLVAGSTQKQLRETGAVLEKLGVSYDTYSKSIQTATKALGVATDQGDDMMLGLTAHAMDLGMPVDQLTNKFAAMSPELAKLGDAGVDAFKDMAQVFKATGFEMEKILRLTNKFDTFEGAAEMAGKLNAALGGNFVNAMELMTETNPVERFKMMQDAIKQTGLSFDEMGYHQSLFYAESLGLENAGELALLMAGDFESLDGNIGKTSKSYEDAAKRARELATVQEQWQIVLAEMTPLLTPIIGAIRKVVGWMVEYKTQIGWVLKVGAGLAIALSLPFVKGAVAIAAVTGAFTALINLLFVEQHSEPFFNGGLRAGADDMNLVATSANEAATATGSLTAAFQTMVKAWQSAQGALRGIGESLGLVATPQEKTAIQAAAAKFEGTRIRDAAVSRVASPVAANARENDATRVAVRETAQAAGTPLPNQKVDVTLKLDKDVLAKTSITAVKGEFKELATDALITAV